MLNSNQINITINRSLNALRDKRIKSNPDARDALRAALGCLNEARLLFNQGDANAAFWAAVTAHEFIYTARRSMAGAL